MEKSVFLLLFSFCSILPLTPKKTGNYVNLAICVIPYITALLTHEKGKLIQQNNESEEKKEVQYPIIGFGEYGSEMILYLVTMFLTQKFLWYFSTQYLDTKYQNNSEIKAYCLYSTLGAFVGTLSSTTGIFCAKKVSSFFAKTKGLKKSSEPVE